MKYFVVQNIATKKIRVYERNFKTKNNKLIFEEDIVPGKDLPGKRSVLGRFKLSRWFKFYQDFKGKHPSWYKEGLKIPPKGSSFMDWTRSEYLEREDQGLRGAFGWYTAHLEPNAKAQWMHGTVGHGADSHRFINKGEGYFDRLKSLKRASSGCTRLNNEAITYLRDILPVGTPIFKIYAKESAINIDNVEVFDALNPFNSKKSDIEYKSLRFPYVLTSDKDEKSGVYSGKKVDFDKKLDSGIYFVDRTPTIVNFIESNLFTTKLENRINKGNTYKISEDQFKGVFNIDLGKLEGYEHPINLTVTGYTQNPFPDYLIN